ncbi:nitroreductase family protein [Chloroflexota bacterium]
MQFFELIEKRYSVRSYKPDPVEEYKIQRIMEAARLAPTAANKQPFRLILINTAEIGDELSRVYGKPWFTQAPLVICACGIPTRSWKRRDGKVYCDVDVAIAMDHLILAAADLGLGTCWIADFDPVVARGVLRLPDDIEPIAFTPIGYPNDEPGLKKRRPVAELVNYGRWQD